VAKRGRTALLTNETADAMVTESAAAATQIATGVKATRGSISMGADGKTPLPTILEMAQKARMATGLVTTASITDATPAAFAAHVAQRRDEVSVAAQEIALGVDVLLGGGKQSFLPEAEGGARKDGRNLVAEARRAGYTILGSVGDLREASGGKLLGLFNGRDMGLEIDRARTAGPGEPSLAEMAVKALGVLGRAPHGFFLMIESGGIDHAAHLNDTAAAVREVLAFDEAVGVALEFQGRNPDTLLLVTADHETGGMALIGNSKDSQGYVGIDLLAVQGAEASFGRVLDQLGASPTPEKVRQVVKKDLGLEITEEEARLVADDIVRKLDPYNYRSPTVHSLAFVLRPYLRVGWASQTHTASPLFAFASGPGSEALLGFHHNTDLFRIMSAALPRTR
jgi:alkaline phosphatase